MSATADEPIDAAWQQRIDEAQDVEDVEIAGSSYPRVPYGGEVRNPKPRCRDCGVQIGQLHILSCCIELCPICKGQLISCGCALDEDDHRALVH